MSDYRRHPLEGGVGATARPERRGWSVIVCPRQGRRHAHRHLAHHPVHLRLEPTRVSGCSCEDLQWTQPQHNLQQDGRRPSGPSARRAPLQRAFSVERPPSPLGPGATPPHAHAWAAPLVPLRGDHPLAQLAPLSPLAPELRVPGTKLRVYGPEFRVHGQELRVHGTEQRVHSQDLRVHGTEQRSHGPELRVHAHTRAMEPPSTWMPNTRRLLLEPAPSRLRGLPAARLPYGGPALRAPLSAFRCAAPKGAALGGGLDGGELLYGLRPGSAPAVPSALALLSEHAARGRRFPYGAPLDLEPPHPHGASPPSLLDALFEPAPLLRSQVLRVLRPDELEQRSPVLPTLGGANPTLPAPATSLAVVPAEEEVPKIVAGPAGGSSDEDDTRLKMDVQKEPSSPKAAEQPTAKLGAGKGLSVAENRANRRQWLLRIVRENFNEQIGTLVERFVRRPRHDKSVRRVPGVGRKVNVNLQNFWKRNSGQERLMKTKDLLGVYTDSGMDWKGFQRWLTKDLQFMPSCAKLCSLSLDIYQKYWSTDWDDAGTTG